MPRNDPEIEKAILESPLARPHNFSTRHWVGSGNVFCLNVDCRAWVCNYPGCKCPYSGLTREFWSKYPCPANFDKKANRPA